MEPIRDLEMITEPGNIQPGAVVIIENSVFGNYNYTIANVERVTKTMIVVNGFKFKKGMHKTSDWTWETIYNATPQAIAEIMNRNMLKSFVGKLRDALNNSSFVERITVDDAVKISEILKLDEYGK